ncbi:fibrobacter succinogenes major paralogous domain-containing protein [Litoribacter alkaliphilus]|uniref:Fibrobacter succinogenes major paralogous domain-containing protein n=1 Tax=Litoribacter ruber TaxID=702568 RepID=A0AAP2G4F4_9BACT|nr:fibrobacter succinogenes major paralogous domain-containing protein [Litoribacter alkaliphilus]MBS9524001.1 fibrobacter succinogenes major paralogous domain-containing protein [Litoribacter alkaliphilus]
MKKLLYIFLLLGLLSCTQEEEIIPTSTLQFTGINIADFGQSSINARQADASDWQHVLPDYIEISIVNQQTGDELLLPLDPNDFSTPYSVDLPFGDYVFSYEPSAGVFEDYLPFETHGAFAVNGSPVSITIEAFSDYGLVSLRNEYVEASQIVSGGDEKELRRSADRNFYYQYVRGGTNGTLRVIEHFDREVLEMEVAVEAANHYHYYLQLPEQGNAYFQLVLTEFSLIQEGLDLTPAVEGVVRDAEGNVYKVVKIGNQYWMAENLRSSTFCNGDPLEDAGQPNWDWEYGNDIPGAWSFDNQPEYDIPYGKLYNNRAVVDDRNICPCGYKVPSLDDWRELRDYLGGSEEAPEKMRSTNPRYWIEEFHRTATNESDFNAVGAGLVWLDLFGYNFPSYFSRFNEMTSWWTSTVEEMEDPWFPYDVVHSVWLSQTLHESGFDNPDNVFLRSVRCIRE